MPVNETRVDSYQRLVDASGQMPEGLTVNSVVFTFITSAPRQISPLMSTLSISNVTKNLNRTEVICVDRATRNSSSTPIKVINSDEDIQGS